MATKKEAINQLHELKPYLQKDILFKALGFLVHLLMILKHS